MKAINTRTVLVVSGFNEFVDTFLNMPTKPVGIVEISSTLYRSSWLNGQKLCEEFCLKHALNYANLSQANISSIAQYFERWEAELVVTYMVPILPMCSLSTVSLGGINVHHSCLPAYRGGNPILWQIMDDLNFFGITVHVLEAQVDRGDILGQVQVLRSSGRSKQQLLAESNRSFAVPLLHSVVTGYIEKSLTLKPQPEHSTTAWANHVRPQDLLGVLAQKNVSLNGLWDTACFLTHLPPECAPQSGWQAWCRWVPKTAKGPCSQSTCAQADAFYTLIPVGLTLHLIHPDGCVVFKPKWQWATILSRLLT